MSRTSSSEIPIKNMITSLFHAIRRSGRLLYLILFLVICYFSYQFFTKKIESSTIEYDTNLIQVQIKNVGKLVVTEGHFAEVLTYKDKRKLIFLDYHLIKKHWWLLMLMLRLVLI